MIITDLKSTFIFDINRFVLLLGAGDKKEEIATAARTTLTSGVRKLNAKDNGILRTKKLAEDEAILPDFQGCSL